MESYGECVRECVERRKKKEERFFRIFHALADALKMKPSFNLDSVTHCSFKRRVYKTRLRKKKNNISEVGDKKLIYCLVFWSRPRHTLMLVVDTDSPFGVWK